MKLYIFSVILIFGRVLCLNAQPPNTQPAQKTPASVEELKQANKNQRTSNRRFAPQNSGDLYNRRINSSARINAFQFVGNLYRKPTREESEILANAIDDLKIYAQFLRQPDTGLTKLITDRGCDEYTDVLNVSEDCLKYSMPGAGSSFSFRTENYRISRLSDLSYKDKGFHSLGVLSHAMLVNIGDVPLEQITLQTNGLKYLNDFQTVSSYEKAGEIDEQLTNGIEANGFFYSRSAKADENTTFVLRSIAYRGNFYRAMQGFVYDELDFDQRRDVTVAFRIVRSDDESVTIIWKILAKTKSPAIRKLSRDQMKMRENKFMAGTEKKDDN